MMTLDDLKAENAKLEAEQSTDPQTVEEEVESKAVEEDLEEAKEVAEPAEEDTKSAETEDWMKGEETQADRKFTGSDIKAAKTKLRAKLERQHESVVDELKAEIEALKQETPASVVENAKPKREDFYENDDPEGAYIDALTDWKIEQKSVNQVKQSQEREMQAKVQQREAAIKNLVDQHYERAVVLASESGISPELYQSADLVVRSAIEALFPKKGDMITDSLIANLGDGSEKVFYNLGVNRSRLSELKQSLEDDPSGLKASMFLGKLSAQLVAPQKRTTNAPAPTTQLSGEKQKDVGFRALKKRYDDAHKQGNLQAAFDAKREARRAGANVKTW